MRMGYRSLVRRVTGPKGHWSEGSLVRRVTGPKGHWSEGSLVRRVTGLKDLKDTEYSSGRVGPWAELHKIILLLKFDIP